MQGQSITTYYTLRRAPNTPREVVGIIFRHRRLVVLSFLATFAGVVIATVLFGMKYEAQTEILVKRQRPADLVTTEEVTNNSAVDDLARAREINTEVELLKSKDLLQQVVQTSLLDGAAPPFWSAWIPSWGAHNRDQEAAKAVRRLEEKLQVNALPDSNIIQVKYASRDPERAAAVLRNLDNLYIAKHLAVHRPPGVADFFQQQTQHYQTELSNAEARLASFDLERNAAAPDLERDILLKKASEFNAELEQTKSDIAATDRRIGALEHELSATPSRLPTAQTTSQNPELLANLKTSLQNLEIQRTDLLEKFQPDYRPVKEIEKQIAQVQTAIAAAEKNPLRQQTTDQNSTYQMLQGELAKAKAERASLHAKANATAPVVSTYSKEALLLDQKNLQRGDLLREVKTAEQNYLLYLNKGEQARISDALDKRQILNVAVAETATVPALPINSPWLLVLAGGILAVMISVGSAFTVDYFDTSFRTPDEVVKYLDVPVLAAFPKNGHAPRFGLPPAEPGDSISNPGKGRTRLFSWRRSNGD